MKLRFPVSVFFVSLFSFAQQPANLIVNGSFEQGPASKAFVNLAAGVTTVNGWAVTGEGIDYINGLWPGSQGVHSIDLDGSASSRATPPYAIGGVAQTFATVPGKAYLVTFDLAGNPFGGLPSKSVRVSAAGQMADFQFSTAGKDAGNMGWARQNWTFTANATSTTLEFRSLNIAPNTGWGAAIDNVSAVQLDPVSPEITQAAPRPPAPTSPQQPAAPVAPPQAARTQPFQMETMYQCASGMSFKVLSCAGANEADQCQVQSFLLGQPYQRGQSTRQQVHALLPQCHVQTAADVQAQTKAAQAALAAAKYQTGAGGFKVGDTVQVLTAFGWVDTQVRQVNGNSYQVQLQGGPMAWKTYPAEVRRIGAPNAEDRSRGVYALGDRVQVNIDGKWVDGKIVTELNQEYQVQLAGNQTVWAKAVHMRLNTAPPAPVGPKPGTPPRQGLVSCAGKFEGRYANTGSLGNLTIIFRSGKAILADPTGRGEELECWTGGGKIYLHKPGDPIDKDMPLDINNDGTLDTPFGEIKKKGN